MQSLCVSGFVFIAKQSNIDANEKLKYIFNELKKLDRLRILDLQGEVENDFVNTSIHGVIARQKDIIDCIGDNEKIEDYFIEQ